MLFSVNFSVSAEILMGVVTCGCSSSSGEHYVVSGKCAVSFVQSEISEFQKGFQIKILPKMRII